MKLFKKIKALPKYNFKGKGKDAIRAILITDYMAIGHTRVLKEYNKVQREALKVLLDRTNGSSWKFWKRTVLNKYHNKNVFGGQKALRGEQRENADWLEGFWKRLRRNAFASKEDKNYIKSRIMPFFKVRWDSETGLPIEARVILRQYSVDYTVQELKKLKESGKNEVIREKGKTTTGGNEGTAAKRGGRI